MALFISMTETRLRRMLLVFFILGSLFPVMLTLIAVYQYVIPELTLRQVERLRGVFNNALLAILLIQLLSFVLFWHWIKSWETMKKRITMISSQILKKKQTADLGENEIHALQGLFQQIHDEFQSLASRLGEYFRRSITDEITSLFNRTYFRFKLTDEMRRAQEDGMDLSLIMFGIDDFGQYSDEIEDYLLRSVAMLLRRHIRKTDLPFRCGRNRFALLLPGCSGKAATSLAEKLADAVGRHPFSDPHNLPLKRVTISCGVAFSADNAEDLVDRAKAALDRARARGRARTAVDGGGPAF
ncbi:MAG: GGDEF domain-containing protein [Desulfobacterales bacterium]|jgi:diguanylate cyclase (GGDEF)-like protein